MSVHNLNLKNAVINIFLITTLYLILTTQPLYSTDNYLYLNYFFNDSENKFVLNNNLFNQLIGNIFIDILKIRNPIIIEQVNLFIKLIIFLLVIYFFYRIFIKNLKFYHLVFSIIIFVFLQTTHPFLSISNFYIIEIYQNKALILYILPFIILIQLNLCLKNKFITSLFFYSFIYFSTTRWPMYILIHLFLLICISYLIKVNKTNKVLFYLIWFSQVVYLFFIPIQKIFLFLIIFALFIFLKKSILQIMDEYFIYQIILAYFSYFIFQIIIWIFVNLKIKNELFHYEVLDIIASLKNWNIFLIVVVIVLICGSFNLFFNTTLANKFLIYLCYILLVFQIYNSNLSLFNSIHLYYFKSEIKLFNSSFYNLSVINQQILIYAKQNEVILYLPLSDIEYFNLIQKGKGGYSTKEFNLSLKYINNESILDAPPIYFIINYINNGDFSQNNHHLFYSKFRKLPNNSLVCLNKYSIQSRLLEIKSFLRVINLGTSKCYFIL